MNLPSRFRTGHARRGLLAVIALATGLAACGGSATASPAAPSSSPAAVASPPPSASAAPAQTPTPSPTPALFTSAAYDYRSAYPGTWVASQAQEPWDGTARIDSNGPYTDQVMIPGSILFFVYGAPTTLTAEEYAAQGQAQVAAWHGCPAKADSVAEVAVDGAPGRLHAFLCSGLLVQKLMVVRDGEGLVLNMLAPPDGETDPRALFREIVAGITWPA